MASFVKFNKGVEALIEAVNAQTDTWKIALTNRAPVVSTDATLSDAAEIAAGSGYTAGGNACAVSSSSQTGGVYKLVLSSPATWTSSGTIGPFRYAVLYDATTDSLIGYWDYGSAVTLTTGETFQVVLDGSNGVFTVQ